ncbi:Hsp70 family protein [Dactylosporangium sp. CS-047395]|uniref:Hsp70 family protein n=1 Tax=Dactylosporangium sp. CS-047395 TaxID=3239936 RepID=UPI003D9021B7
MPLRFAVDLGTSNTVAVVDRGDGSPRPLLFDGSPLLPSAVFADASGGLLVGRDAERHMMTDAARFEPNPKGRVDDGVILLGDREVPVAELLAAVLRRAASEAGGSGPLPTVLTCPVDWGNTRRSVLLDAARRAGLGPVTLVDEPVSAATYCVRALGGRLAPGRCAVVFDFGGGTLDVTVVQAQGAAPLRVLATGGLADLGGTDIDDALVGHVGRLIEPDLWQRMARPRTPGEYRDRRTFWSEVRQAKEMLARAASAPIHVPGRDGATHLTREELDRIAGPLVDRAVDETRRVLQRSGVTPAHLDAIVLVGGSSRLPLVASRLHARFGLAPIVPEQPELPVAFGALLLTAGDPTPTATPSHGYPMSATALVSSTPVAPISAPVVPQQPRRPSVVIGPGVTIQGNVAIYGDDSLMPRDDDDEPEPEPSKPPKPPRRRGRSWLRFAALPLLPWVIIMAVTPWGRALFNDGKARVESLLGATPTPTASASAAPSTPPPLKESTATVQLQPNSGKAGTTVQLTAHGFATGEKIEVRAGTKLLTTLTADDSGSAEASVVIAPAGTKAGQIVVQLLGRTSRKSAPGSFRVTG